LSSLPLLSPLTHLLPFHSTQPLHCIPTLSILGSWVSFQKESPTHLSEMRASPFLPCSHIPKLSCPVYPFPPHNGHQSHESNLWLKDGCESLALAHRKVLEKESGGMGAE
jgi:hypothetical protein